MKKYNLFNAFRDAMLSDPKAARKEAFKHFVETVQSNPAYLEALAEDYFYRAAAQWDVQKIGKNGSYSLVGTAATKRRVALSAERRSEAVKKTEEMKSEFDKRFRAVLLLEIQLPNGKKLRDATGAECAKAGGFYAEVARHVKPTQVVDKHLNEKDLREIQSRFEGKRNGAGAALHA